MFVRRRRRRRRVIIIMIIIAMITTMAMKMTMIMTMINGAPTDTTQSGDLTQYRSLFSCVIAAKSRTSISIAGENRGFVFVSAKRLEVMSLFLIPVLFWSFYCCDYILFICSWCFFTLLKLIDIGFRLQHSNL